MTELPSMAERVTRLNWVLVHWLSKASVLTIGLGREDHEVWTFGSLRVALVQLVLRGQWNNDEETSSGLADVVSDPAPRDLYRSIPARLVYSLLRPSTSYTELKNQLDIKVGELKNLSDLDTIVPSGTRLDSDEFAWLVLASAAMRRDLHIYPEEPL